MTENRKKSVLIFSLAYRPLIGGAEIALEEITKRIDDYDFHLITAKFKKESLNEEKIGRVNVYRVGFGCKLDKYLFFILAWFKGVALQNKHKFEIVWGMMANYAGLAALLFKWSYNPKYLLTLQSGDSDKFIMKRTWFWYPLYQQIYKQADIIQPISNWLAARAKNHGFRGRIQIIPNGFDQEFFNKKLDEAEKNDLKRKLGINEASKIIITVSRLVEKNGLADLIASLKYLPDNYMLLIVGEGRLKKRLEDLADELRVSSRIIFVGEVANQEVYKYLNIADVFARPALSEGFGNVFVEAMAAGLPVVATFVGGIKDFLVDEETGLVCQKSDPESVAKQVKKLEDENLRNKIIANGLELSKKYYWENIALAMKELFSQLYLN